MMTSKGFIRCKCRIDVKRYVFTNYFDYLATVESTNNLDCTLRTHCCSPSNVQVHPCASFYTTLKVKVQFL